VPAHNIKTENMMRGGAYRLEGSDISCAEPVNSAAIVLVLKKFKKKVHNFAFIEPK
jgi:hypothetical protein